MEEDKLYIPENVQKRKEIATGIGKKELRIILLHLLLGVVVGLVIFLIKGKNFFPAIPMAGMIFTLYSYVFYKKDKTNFSTMNGIRHSQKFKKCQKEYRYEKLEDWKYEEK